MTHLTFRRHYKLIVLLALVAALLIAGMGNQPLMSYSVHDTPVTGLAGGYSHALAALVDAAAGAIQVPGTVQTLSVLGSR